MSSPTNNTSQAGSARQIITVSLLLFWLALLGFAALNRQNIIDWWRLRQYQAPAAIASLADQATLTDYSRKVFYVNWPQQKDKTGFGSACPNNGGEQTIVLGCYHGNQAGIYLLKVTDARLNGVEQVTAAHEMLHAAYDRLGQDERDKVDAMLTNYYKNELKDERILKTIEAYKKSEPNELVSVERELKH